jgi:hypothetical protein
MEANGNSNFPPKRKYEIARMNRAKTSENCDKSIVE